MILDYSNCCVWENLYVWCPSILFGLVVNICQPYVASCCTVMLWLNFKVFLNCTCQGHRRIHTHFNLLSIVDCFQLRVIYIWLHASKKKTQWQYTFVMFYNLIVYKIYVYESSIEDFTVYNIWVSCWHTYSPFWVTKKSVCQNTWRECTGSVLE